MEAAADAMGLRGNAEPNLAKSNKMKVIISCFVIGLLVLPLGWTYSSVLANGSFAPPPTELDIAAVTVSAPTGITLKQAVAILSGRYPDLAIDTDLLAMNTVSGPRLNP